MKNNLNEYSASEGEIHIDAFLFAEFHFADEIEIEKLYEKFYFMKETEIDNSLQRLEKRGYLDRASGITRMISFSEQEKPEFTIVTKWRLTDKGSNLIKNR